MIRKLNGNPSVFILDTENTTYVFSVTSSGHLEHLYYGAKMTLNDAEECEVFREKREFEVGNAIAYSKEYSKILLEDMCLEFSSLGHGDVREPFVELIRADGSRTANFLYDSDRIDDAPSDFTTLPSSYTEEGKAEHLCVTVKDGDLALELHYRVYPDCDVITRAARLCNHSKETVVLERLMSAQIDIPFSGVCVTSFHGAWAREMNKNTSPLTAGKFIVESRTGFSSNRANPFFMVHEPAATEHSGSVYGFNLVYSGNHYAATEVNAYGKTRILHGIQPGGFRYLLREGETFEAPEAVMTYSAHGFTGQSVNMHRFVRRHIVRGKWKNKPRPVLLNSWEAFYFGVNEHNMVQLAKAGKKLGIELFVMDDGWFGERDNDTKSLGDWEPSKTKLPGGLSALAEKINKLDMDFGIWVEPEMVNVESNLYREHPDWAMAIEGRPHSEGRTQRVLDLANPVVQDFLIAKMSEVFSSANIRYVKWDMNRIFSDVFSPYLPAEQQGETAHRYICGLYRVMQVLTERFPEILFEGCASGGNRFDLGILCYFPQIWASDNTDAICRATIQEGYSYGYPQSCIGAHVSAIPNHQTLRKTPLDTRFATAAFGVLGYECDVRDLDNDSRQKISRQIALYQQWREVMQFGQFYRLLSGNVHEWICVSADKTRAVCLLLQELTVPNMQAQRLFAAGLDKSKTYRLYNIPDRVDIRQFGSLINTVAPIHVKQDSLVHNVIAKAVKMNSENENMTVSGDVLLHTGVALKPAYGGTGFNENVRIFPDFAARLYFLEAT
ncbi:MAG: alpha-galactosidase [Ruminococcus sp.]|nr:alpha-galactosidase [Ruminococcus sp.]